MIAPRYIRLARSCDSLDRGLLDLRGLSEGEVLAYLEARAKAMGTPVLERPDGRTHATTGALVIWVPEGWGDESDRSKAVTLAHELSHRWQWRHLRAFGLRYWMSLGFRWAVEVAARRAGLWACYAMGFSKKACRTYAGDAAKSLHSKTYGRMRRLGDRAVSLAVEIMDEDITRLFEKDERP